MLGQAASGSNREGESTEAGSRGGAVWDLPHAKWQPASNRILDRALQFQDAIVTWRAFGRILRSSSLLGH
jgi:hypothetical protein